MTPSHILIATDLSEPSEPAVEAGAELARRFGARVTLVHVFDPSMLAPPAAIPSPKRVEETLAREVSAAVRVELERVAREKITGVETAIEVLEHRHVASAICEYAQENGVDLAVVGTHGRTGIAHLMIGSVAEKVVRHAPCPVLAVRVPAR